MSTPDSRRSLISRHLGIRGPRFSEAVSDQLDRIKAELARLEEIATPEELDAAYKGLSIQIISRIQ